jgi:hypothetical protein
MRDPGEPENSEKWRVQRHPKFQEKSGNIRRVTETSRGIQRDLIEQT